LFTGKSTFAKIAYPSVETVTPYSTHFSPPLFFPPVEKKR